MAWSLHTNWILLVNRLHLFPSHNFTDKNVKIVMLDTMTGFKPGSSICVCEISIVVVISSFQWSLYYSDHALHPSKWCQNKPHRITDKYYHPILHYMPKTLLLTLTLSRVFRAFYHVATNNNLPKIIKA